MSPAAGWYDDPEQPGVQRWWDGTMWTEHRHPVGPAAAEVVRVPAGPGARKALVATTDAITVDDEVFALAELDAVGWTAVRSLQNGAYMGVLYTLRLRAGDRHCLHGMNTGHNNVRYDEFADAHARVVALMDAVVCPRIAEALLARLRGGETITLGPAGARVELTVEGFRLKKPLSKVVPWSDVTGTELRGGSLFFFVRRAGADPKHHSRVPLEGENINVLPHLVPRLTSAG